MYIDRQTDLVAFVERMRACRLLAIDTEFLRERTYYPRLCLLQLAGDDGEPTIVDPLAVEDLTPLAELLRDESITKIFHAGGQDLEILLHEIGVLPTPIFDTQIAAAFLGHTQQIGYGSLVASLCGVSLKKGDSFTDWSLRPLTDSQLAYAADDVIYLPRMYEILHDELSLAGRLSWLDDEFRALLDPERYLSNPRERYRRLKRVSSLSRRELSAAREVAAWREEQAQARDIPRKWVLTDEQIVEACRRESRSVNELYMIRGMRERLAIAEARTVVGLIVKGLEAPPATWPYVEHTGSGEPNVESALDLMNALVRLRARQNDIAVQMLATHDELVALARGHGDNLRLLNGWRKKLIGDELLALLEGKLSLSLRGFELVVETTDAGKL